MTTDDRYFQDILKQKNNAVNAYTRKKNRHTYFFGKRSKLLSQEAELAPQVASMEIMYHQLEEGPVKRLHEIKWKQLDIQLERTRRHLTKFTEEKGIVLEQELNDAMIIKDVLINLYDTELIRRGEIPPDANT